MTCNTCKANKVCDHNKYGFENCNNYIPEDVVEVKHGEWNGKPIAGYGTVKCSVCETFFMENRGWWAYCPNCGARMDG